MRNAVVFNPLILSKLIAGDPQKSANGNRHLNLKKQNTSCGEPGFDLLDSLG